MCSRKYNIRLCLEYILEDVLLVNRAKTTAGPPSFAPLCSYPLFRRVQQIHSVLRSCTLDGSKENTANKS